MNARIALLLVVTAAPALADVGPLELRGRLLQDGVGFDGIVDVHVNYRDNDGLEHRDDDVTGVVIVDGEFTLPFDFLVGVAGDKLNAAEAARNAGGVVTIDIAELDVHAVAVIGRIASVAIATEANVALHAASAQALGGVAMTDLVTSSGGLRPSLLNATGLPNGLVDGDQGTVDAVGSGLTLTGTVVDVATAAVTSAAIVDGTVGSTQIADGSVGSAKVASVGANDVAVGTLTGDDFNGAAFDSGHVVGNRRALFKEPKGCSLTEDLTTSTVCVKPTNCPDGSNDHDCATGVCDGSPGSTCSTTRLGELLFAP